jgi:hypothetical protein
MSFDILRSGQERIEINYKEAFRFVSAAASGVLPVLSSG